MKKISLMVMVVALGLVMGNCAVGKSCSQSTLGIKTCTDYSSADAATQASGKAGCVSNLLTTSTWAEAPCSSAICATDATTKVKTCTN